MMDLFLIAPELTLLGGILFLLVYGVLGGKNGSSYEKILVLLVLAVTVWVGISFPSSTCWGGLYRVDTFALLGKGLTMVTLLVIFNGSDSFVSLPELRQFERSLLWLLACLGMMCMVSAHDLMTLFLGIELQSLSLYILVALQRNYKPVIEAALKYFLLGIVATAFFLYGASLVYGYTGSTNYEAIWSALHQGETPSILILVAISLIVVGVGFKISLAPFHMWVPDVYEHIPPLTATFLVGAPKVASLMVLMRLLMGPFAEFSEYWQVLLSGLSILSMVGMSLTALSVTHLQRLMGFSGVSHMGYALVGLISGNEGAIHNSLIYMMVYLVASTGFFLLLLSLKTYLHPVKTLDDLKGLASRRPGTAFLMTLFILSLAGIPPFAGFFGKFYVFLSAIESGAYEVAIAGLLSSVVSSFYYLRLIKVMYFDSVADPLLQENSGSSKPLTFKAASLLCLMAGFCVFFFCISKPFMGLCKKASLSLIS